MSVQERLDQGTTVLATQDFRHTVQEEMEGVADFIRRLERVFHIMVVMVCPRKPDNLFSMASYKRG